MRAVIRWQTTTSAVSYSCSNTRPDCDRSVGRARWGVCRLSWETHVVCNVVLDWRDLTLNHSVRCNIVVCVMSTFYVTDQITLPRVWNRPNPHLLCEYWSWMSIQVQFLLSIGSSLLSALFLSNLLSSEYHTCDTFCQVVSNKVLSIYVIYKWYIAVN